MEGKGNSTKSANIDDSPGTQMAAGATDERTEKGFRNDTDGIADLELTSSHLETLPELAKWWTLVNDSLHFSDSDSGHIPASLLNDTPWLHEFRTTVKNILQTRNIGDREREMVLTLASSMTAGFGAAWFNGDSKLLQLLANFAAIDVRLILDRDRSLIKEIDSAEPSCSTDHSYIGSCCQLLEMALQCTADFESTTNQAGGSRLEMTQDQALQINKTLLDLTNFIFEYLADMDERKVEVSDAVLYPLYRFVCAYLAEGLALVRRDNLMAAAKALVHLNESNSTIASKEQGERFDTTALFLPALSELIEMEGADWLLVKKAFRDQGVVRLIENYFENSANEGDTEILTRWKQV